MLVQNPLEEFTPDKTLNASTSEAWLNHWKAYLKRKGVQFFVGRFTGLEKDAEGKFVPKVEGPKPKGDPIPEYDNSDFDPAEPAKGLYPDGSNFYVMALPFTEASRIVWEAWKRINTNNNHDDDNIGLYRTLPATQKLRHCRRAADSGRCR